MGMLKRTILMLLVGFTWVQLLIALEQEKLPSQFHRDDYTVKNGLPSGANSVGKVMQAPDGTLLIYTDKGLYRFDGLSYEPVDLKFNFLKLLHGVTDFLVDKKSTIWVGGSGGLVKISDSETILIKEKDGLPQGKIDFILEDSRGFLWVIVKSNLLYIKSEEKFLRMVNFNNALIVSISEDRNGNIWACGWQDELFVVKGSLCKKVLISSIPKNFSMSQIFFDKENGMWLAGDNGLLVIEPNTRGGSDYGNGKVTLLSQKEGFILNNTFAIIEDSDGCVWLGGMGGVNRVKRIQGNGVKYVVDSIYKGGSITTIYEDREKSIWIGSICNGLVQLRDTSFQTYGVSHGVSIRPHALYVTPKNEILAGSSLGHILCFEKGNFLKLFEVGNSINSAIVSMVMDSEGALWVGTLFSGLFRIKNRKIESFGVKDGLPGDFIRSVTLDSKGRLWVGTAAGGTAYRENGMFRVFSKNEGLANNAILNIVEDRQKNILIGTKDGLTLLRSGEISEKNIQIILEYKQIYSIHEDLEVDGLYWVGTFEKGLWRFKDGKINSITTKNGLGNNTIYQILEDNWGYFWISSGEGILKVSKHRLNAYFEGKINSVECTIFGFSDGLDSMYSRLSGNNTAIKTPIGEFWFSTQNGISTVNPAREIINRVPPPVFIRQILKNNEIIANMQESNRFKDCRRVNFTLSVPSFVTPSRIRIRYKLEGYDKYWNDLTPSTKRNIEYWNLPFGKYRFQAQAANSSGVWNLQGVAFAFSVEPYFYQTLFFKFFVVLFSGLALVVLFLGLKRFWYLQKLKNKYKNSTLDPEKVENYLKKLHHLMEIEKLFKDENLSLQTLAEKMGISPRDLSRIINERMEKNFRDMINGFRIEEAKRMVLNSKKNHSILDIAFESGFNSKEVFNRAFKKYTGMTPSEYKKK